MKNMSNSFRSIYDMWYEGKIDEKLKNGNYVVEKYLNVIRDFIEKYINKYLGRRR